MYYGIVQLVNGKQRDVVIYPSNWKCGQPLNPLGFPQERVTRKCHANGRLVEGRDHLEGNDRNDRHTIIQFASENTKRSQ